MELFELSLLGLIISITFALILMECRQYEPPHDKTNKMSFASSEDSDQPGHPPSLIRVFAVRMKKGWIHSYPLSAQRRLCSDWADAQADLSSLGAQSLFWFCHVAAHISIQTALDQLAERTFRPEHSERGDGHSPI